MRVRRLGLLACCVLAGCQAGDGTGAVDGGTTVPPPRVCNSPVTPDGAWFTEVTDEMGLTAAGALGTSVRAADLDGDGFPDLISTVAHVVMREVPGGPRARFLLMNRPHPADPQRRVFVDATAESGLLTTADGAGGRAFGIANVGDVDNDGDLDVIVCPGAPTADDPCGVLLNDGTAHFTLAPSGELDGVGAFEAASAALLDYDRDGILDYWPGNFDDRPYLFRGAGGGDFHEVAAEVGLPIMDGDPATGASFRETFSVTACDLDGDGDQDVLLGDYGRQLNQVWINDGAGHFSEQGAALGIAADDRLDYSDDQSYRCHCQAHPGACPAGVPAPPAGYCPGRGWIVGASDQPWRLGGNTFSIACGDLDDDGDMDLMTADLRHGDVGSASDPSELLRNDAPPAGPLRKFVRPGNAVTGLDRMEKGIGWDEGDMMAVMADLDLDGRKDLYLTSSDYPGDHGWVWRQTSPFAFSRIAGAGIEQPQIHGVALCDLDGDGDLDLVAGTSTARGVAPTNALRVYRNDVGQASNWIQVQLVGGAGANRAAIGARVTVTAGGRTQVQEVSGGYGHNSIQNDLVLTFGLGSACDVDRIDVRWPDGAGTLSTFTDVRANYRVRLEAGARVATYLVR